MTPAATPAFDLYREQIEGMVYEEGALSSVEQALDRTELPPDERDALWLLAWSLSRRPRSGRVLHRSVRRRLALVQAPGRA